MTQNGERRERVESISDEDLARVQEVLGRIGGPNVVWGAQQILDVWVAETRMESERRSSHRLLTATWVLVAATVVLALATVGLIVATLHHP